MWPASHHGYVSTVTGVFSVYIHFVLDGLRILEPSSTKTFPLRGARCLVSVPLRGLGALSSVWECGWCACVDICARELGMRSAMGMETGMA